MIRGALDKFRSSLRRTREGIFGRLQAIFGGRVKLDEDTLDTVKEVVQSLVLMLDEASQIVDFFKKLDEQKRVKKNIKRMIIKHYNLSLVKPVTDRFMELAHVKFK